ncbi:MAG: hypothetical protein AAFV53_19585 [Myxococcota bacterium]
MSRLFGLQRLVVLSGFGLSMASCDTISDILNVQMPSAGLQRVDLVKAPSANRLMAWGCYAYVPGAASACPLAGFNNQPNRSALTFSFDIVFDLFNPNASFPVPLVEMLMGIDVFEGNNLGAVCVNFCDPDTEDCSTVDNAVGTCSIEDAQQVEGVQDVQPTVDDLLNLAEDIRDGSLEDNLSFRVIPKYTEQSCSTGTCEEIGSGDDVEMCCGDECAPLEIGCAVGAGDNGQTCALCDGHTEAHIQFDLDIDAMLGLFENLFNDAFDDVLAGRSVQLAIPYSAKGNLFFDVPQMGRYALGFGPFDSEWDLE